MLQFYTTANGGNIVEAMVITAVGLSLFAYPILTVLIMILSSVRDWLYDESDTNTFTMTKFVSKFQNEKNTRGYYRDSDTIWLIGWMWSAVWVLGIVFYYVGIFLLTIYLIMYTLRATIRLRTVLKTHMEDKKAHQ